MHRSSTRFPQAVSLSVAAVLLAFVSGLQAAGADAVLFRIFLKDGGTLVSYGEFARVADRVVLSVPVGDPAAGVPRLQVIGIPDAAVDWTRTEAYADAVRAAQYAKTRGEQDFAILTGHVTTALNQIDAEQDPARRLAMAEEARGNLAAWPAANFGYKAAEVGDLLVLFDETISGLRAAAGDRSFDLSLVANTLSPPPVPLMAAPSEGETFELAMSAATLAPDPADRTALLNALAADLEKAPASAAWAIRLRERVTSSLAAEARAEQAYRKLMTDSLAAAQTRAGRGDVRGLQAVIARALRADETLGRKRPGEMASLLASLDARLGEARRVRLARDAWAVRVELIKEYRAAIQGSVERLASFRKWLEPIRELAGPEPRFLRPLGERAALGHLELGSVTPPAEAQTVHALLASAFHMTRQAAALRMNAVSSNDIKIAWDASAAAAGALSLAARASDELQQLLTPQSR